MTAQATTDFNVMVLNDPKATSYVLDHAEELEEIADDPDKLYTRLKEILPPCLTNRPVVLPKRNRMPLGPLMEFYFKRKEIEDMGVSTFELQDQVRFFGRLFEYEEGLDYNEADYKTKTFLRSFKRGKVPSYQIQPIKDKYQEHPFVAVRKPALLPNEPFVVGYDNILIAASTFVDEPRVCYPFLVYYKIPNSRILVTCDYFCISYVEDKVVDVIDFSTTIAPWVLLTAFHLLSSHKAFLKQWGEKVYQMGV